MVALFRGKFFVGNDNRELHGFSVTTIEDFFNSTMKKSLTFES